ncbi:hypothetical protein EDB85DRAFT_2289331 [Lactarius pseudohatsudake]|nr:hypothetical protein EDB85DRAFT_2289331 [Lactarius pseudohatsudake]
MARDSQLDNVTLNHPYGFSTDAEKLTPQMKTQKGSRCPPARSQTPTLVVHVASVAMCDVPSAALESIRGNSTSGKLATVFLVLDAHYPAGCRSQPAEEDVRGREAEGKRPWGFVLPPNKLAPPPKRLPPISLTLRSRSSVWYQRTDHLCYYTGALLRLLKVYKSSGGRRRSPYIFRSIFLGLVCVQCLLSAPRSVCLLDDITANGSSCHGRKQLFTRQSNNVPALQPPRIQSRRSRQSERRTLTLIYEHLNEAPDALLRTTLTGIPRANRKDAETLRALFGNFTKIAQADTRLLVFGLKRVVRPKDAFARPAWLPMRSQLSPDPTAAHGNASSKRLHEERECPQWDTSSTRSPRCPPKTRSSSVSSDDDIAPARGVKRQWA